MCAINTFLIGLFIGLFFTVITSIYIWNYRFRKGIEERKQKEAQEIETAQNSATKIISEAQKMAESKKRELLIEAKEEIQKSKLEIEKEVKERRTELQQQEKRIIQKEETLDKKIELMEQKEVSLAKRASEIE